MSGEDIALFIEERAALEDTKEHEADYEGARGKGPYLRALAREIREKFSTSIAKPTCPTRRDDTVIAIVRDLAAKEPRADVYEGGTYYRCALCGANDKAQMLAWMDTHPPTGTGMMNAYPDMPTFDLAHAESCPYRRAVELAR